MVLLGGCFHFDFSLFPADAGAGACSTTCEPACGAGKECVVLEAESPAFFSGMIDQAACLKPCRTNDDCASAEHCRVQGSFILPVGMARYCVSASHPSPCGLFSSRCMSASDDTDCDADGQSLERGFIDGDQCGFEVVRCPTRCVRAHPSDAGTEGWVHAACE